MTVATKTGLPASTGAGNVAKGVAVMAALLAVLFFVGIIHVTQGTSGVGPWDLIRYVAGENNAVGGVAISDIVTGSRLPRLFAGIAVGFALGVSGSLLQSITRNELASPDTLAVTAGSYFTLTAVAAFGFSIPLWASGAVAFFGGLAAAIVVLLLTGAGSAASSTRLVLAGSAIAMALDSATALLLILFRENTTGLYAWGSGSLAQLNLDAATRAAPIIAFSLVAALLLARRLDILGLGDDTATTLGVPVRSTKILAILCAVLLAAIAVTLAGPIAFIGLAAPVITRLIAHRIPVLNRHIFFIPVSGLFGALIVLTADSILRAIMGAQAAASIPTGIATSFLGALVIMILALRLRDNGSSRQAPTTKGNRTTRIPFTYILVLTLVLLIISIVVGLLAGSQWLKTGDVFLWLQGEAPKLITRSFNERAPRVGAAVLAGAALGLAGTIVQGTVRNPLAEPGILGITAGAGLGAVIIVTSGIGGRFALIFAAIIMGLLTFGLITLLTWRGGLLPDRFLLVGIGCGYAMTAVTTFLLLRSDPWNSPRILTWLSGTTYGRSVGDIVPVAVVLVICIPIVLKLSRELDLLNVDEDTPTIFGVQKEKTRLILLTLAAIIAAVSVVAVGVIGFVGLVAPHLARTLVGELHNKLIPVSMVIGALFVCVADLVGRSLLAPSQLPAGLVMALIGAPYFVWLLRRSKS